MHAVSLRLAGWMLPPVILMHNYYNNATLVCRSRLGWVDDAHDVVYRVWDAIEALTRQLVGFWRA